MATYTGVSDSNGDFTIPFSQNYTGGQKVTVKAEKEGAEKTIELYAPSVVTGGGVIQFTGSYDDFPNNIGDVIIGSEINNFPENCFNASGSLIWSRATGLEITGSPEHIGDACFLSWNRAKKLVLPESVTSVGFNSFNSWSAMINFEIPQNLKTIGSSAFYGWSNCTSLIFKEGLLNIGNNSFFGWNKCSGIILPDSLKTIGQNAFQNWAIAETLTLGSELTQINNYAFYGWNSLREVIVKASTPPTLGVDAFTFHDSCVFKVPLASLSTYQAAPNWSNYASRMIGI